MSFFMRDNWLCQFLESDLRTPLPRMFRFASLDKVRELAQRGGGFVDSEARNMFEQGAAQGNGGVYLNLTDEQYQTLLRRR